MKISRNGKTVFEISDDTLVFITVLMFFLIIALVSILVADPRT